LARTFRCTIVTPAAAIFDAEIRYASIPAWDGQLGVMAGQSPLLTRLGFGPLRLDVEGAGSEVYLIDGGFGQIAHDTLTIVTERARRPEELSSADADRELAEANARAVAPGEDRRKAEADQAKARAARRMARAAGR
jgi:F-type H+-transporting ATPase subunit epsilon